MVDQPQLLPIKMHAVQLFLVCAIHLVACQKALVLPDGAELLLGNLQTSFSCPNQYGYYADTEMDCKVFHVCNPVPRPTGGHQMQQYSFLCGNQTMFDQLSLSCAYPEDAIPCQSARSFFYLNSRMGHEDVDHLNENDIAHAAPYVSRYSGDWSYIKASKNARNNPNQIQRNISPPSKTNTFRNNPKTNSFPNYSPSKPFNAVPPPPPPRTISKNKPSGRNPVANGFDLKQFVPVSPTAPPRLTPSTILFRDRPVQKAVVTRTPAQPSSTKLSATAGKANTKFIVDDEDGRSDDIENTTPISQTTGSTTRLSSTTSQLIASTKIAEKSTTSTDAPTTVSSNSPQRQVGNSRNSVGKQNDALQTILSVGPRSSTDSSPKTPRRKRVKS